MKQVRNYKNTYNTMLSKITNTNLMGTEYNSSSINEVKSLSELNPAEKLKLEIGVHLNKLIGKTGAKHDDKRNILIIALKVLNDQALTSDLEAAKTTYSKYNRTSSNSETQKLVDRVLDIMPPTALPGLIPS